MGDPDYEARRQRERMERESAAKALEERRQREKDAEFILDSLKALFQGNATLVVETLNDGRTVVRFQASDDKK